MHWRGARVEGAPEFLAQHVLLLALISVSACTEASHKQYQYYHFDELSEAMGATYFSRQRTIPQGTPVAVHGIVRHNQIEEVLKSVQDPEDRKQSKRVMAFNLYPLSPFSLMPGIIKFITQDISKAEAMRKQCEGATQKWPCLILLYGTVTLYEADNVHLASIEMDKIEYRRSSEVSFSLAMRCRSQDRPSWQMTREFTQRSRVF